MHVVASSVGKRLGWASNTEVPYITAAPNPGTKSNTKWADGAMLLARTGVLIEVKTMAARRGVAGSTLSKVPLDLAALVAVDWPATLAHPEDAYSGAIWTAMRSEMSEVIALQLAMVHGPVGELPTMPSIIEVFRQHARKVEARLGDAGLESAGTKLANCFEQVPATWPIRGAAHEAILFGWVVPIA